jgi:uncharacterized 2Fe-2S/4Fe-4S cluster protein (DUF4445 family)
MLPEVPMEKIEKVGNAAVEGAIQVLMSQEIRKEAEDISRKIKNIRLEIEEDFHSAFTEGLVFDKCRRF